MFLFHNKKAQTEQFNWILVMVAGILFLIFFIAFALDYKSLADKRINTKLALALEEQLSLLGTANIITEINPEGLDIFEVKASCNALVMNSGNPISIQDKLIVAPAEMKAEKLLLWIDDLYLPYKIDSIFYLSAPNIKYYFVYDTTTKEFVDSLLEYLPKDFATKKQFFNVEAINTIDITKINTAIRTENLREIKFILFTNTQVPNFGIKTTTIKLQPTADLGFATFSDRTAYYMKMQLLLAAIFSDDYSCILQKALSKLETTTAIYRQKAAILFTKTNTEKPECNYQFIISSFDNVQTEDIPVLYEQQAQLIVYNKNLNTRGCTDVF